MRSLLLLCILLFPASINVDLLSEAHIPTDEKTWSDCCSHHDCKEAKINVLFKADDKADVAIAAYPIFELDSWKIKKSANGKAYFCRKDLSRPPDNENIRCLFYIDPDYVRNK